MERSVKIGIFRIGVKVSKGILYKAKFFVTMEGWRMRKLRNNMKERLVYADEVSAMRKLENNKVVKEVNGKTLILKPPLGIKLWGAVDYLKRCGYTWVW